MTMLSERELCANREQAEASMTDDCTVRRPTEARGTAGGVTQTWADVATLKCRVRSGSGTGTGAREQLLAGRLTPIAVFTVFVPAGSDLQTKDRIEWNGRTLEVHGVIANTNAPSLACVCTEVA